MALRIPLRRSTLGNTAGSSDRQRGDMDGDGSLDTSDLFLLLYLCACRGAGVQTNPTSVELYCADYNADGKIDNLDVYDLMMHLAKVGAGLAEK